MYNIKTSNNKIRIMCKDKKMEDNLTIEFNGETTGGSGEVKGKPYEFNTLEEMEEFISSGEGDYNDVIRYTGSPDGIIIPNTGTYPQIKINYGLTLTNDEIKQIITNANLEFNYSNSLMDIPFNEYIVFSGTKDNGVYIRLSIISSAAFPGEYLIFEFEENQPLPYTLWASIDIPGLNITNGWSLSESDSYSKLTFSNIYNGVNVGVRNLYITDLINMTRLIDYNDKYYYKNPLLTNEWTRITEVGYDSLDITENGEVDITNYKKVNVNVAELNIHYGLEAPTDISKLWVKTNIVPNKFIIRNSLEAYERTSTCLPGVRYNSTCGVVGNKCYIFGGYSGIVNAITNTICCYNTETDSIEIINVTLPQKLTMACCGVVGNKCYIFGGYNNNDSLNTIYCYNAETSTIETMSTTLPQGLRGACCGVVGTKCYLFGGHNGNNIVETIYCYDTETNTIKTMSTSLPYASKGKSCGVVGTKIYLFGGTASEDLDYSLRRSICCYDTEKNTIEVMEETLRKYVYDTCCAVVGKYCYIIGGSYDAFDISEDIYCYDTETNTLLEQSTADNIIKYGLTYSAYGVVGTRCYLFGGWTNAEFGIKSISIYNFDHKLPHNTLLLINDSTRPSVELMVSPNIKMEASIGEFAYIGDENNERIRVELYTYHYGDWKLIW